MRYFDIILTDSSGKALDRWRSHDDNMNAKPNAIKVEINAPITLLSQADNNTSVIVYGLELSRLRQSYNPVDSKIEVYGGMGKGLPFAKPEQAGLLFRGDVFSVYPVYSRGMVAVKFDIRPSLKTPRAEGGNFIFKWDKGMQLSTAIKNMFPDFAVTANVSPQLTTNFNMLSRFVTTQDFARWLKQYTQAFKISNKYTGVDFHFENNALIFDDHTGTTSDKPKDILITDFIGQPTWQGLQSVDCRVCMRGDLKITDKVRLPELLASTYNQQIITQKVRETLSFKGDWTVQGLTHLGDSRGGSADSWVTILNLLKYA